MTFFQCYYSNLPVCPFLHSRYATCYQYCAKFSKGSPTAAKATAPRRNGTPVGGSSCTKLHDTTIQAQYSSGKNFTLFPEALNNTEEYMFATICMPAWPGPRKPAEPGSPRMILCDLKVWIAKALKMRNPEALHPRKKQNTNTSLSPQLHKINHGHPQSLDIIG